MSQLKKEIADVKNNKENSEYTDLHIFTVKRDLTSLIKLISNENSISFNHGSIYDLNVKASHGNTALHLAFICHFLDITRTLLALGADPNIINDDGETPRHLAAAQSESNDFLTTLVIGGAKRCSLSTTNCNNLCINEKLLPNEWASPFSFDAELKRLEERTTDSANQNIDQYNIQNKIYEDIFRDGQLKKKFSKIIIFLYDYNILKTLQETSENETKNFVNVLSLDGGGIRGLVILQILIEIEKELDEPIFPYFDWVAGTSTGGIIAACLAKGKSLRDCQKLYLRLKDTVFDGKRIYNTKIFETFLQKEVGENTRLNDIIFPKLIIPTVKADKMPPQTELMCNYQIQSEEDDLLLWKVLRRTSAAPTYFEPADGKYIDGGFSSNNPLHDLLTKINSWNLINKNMKVRIGCAVSIGTGIAPNTSSSTLSLGISKNPFFIVKTIKSLYNLSTVAIEQVTASEGNLTQHAFARCNESGVSYFRLNPPLSTDIPLDAKENLEIVKMMWECVEYAYMQQKNIKKIALLLKKIGPSFSRKHLIKRVSQPSPSILPVNEYIISAKSNDPDIAYVALKKLRESILILSDNAEKMMRCEEIVHGEIHSVLNKCLKNPRLSIKYEAACILNILIKFTNFVINHDEISLLFELLILKKRHIREQAIYALYHCMLRSDYICVICMNRGIISLLTQLDETSPRFLSYVSLIFRLAFTNEILSFETGKNLIPTVSKLILLPNRKTLTNTMDLVLYFIYRGFSQPFIDMFNKMDISEKQLQNIYYNIIRDIFIHQKHGYQLMGISFLSNISCENVKRIHAMIKSEFLPSIFMQLENAPNDIKNELHDFCSKIIFMGTSTQISALINNQKLLPFYCKYLEGDVQDICKTLEHLNIVLEKSNFKNKEFHQMLIECGAVKSITRLQNHTDVKIVEYSNNLITAFKMELFSQPGTRF